MRWAIWLALLSATLWALFSLQAEQEDEVVEAVERPVLSPEALAANNNGAPDRKPVRMALPATYRDPFQANDWSAKPTLPASPTPPPPMPVVAPPPITPTAPMLPFRYVGQLNDGQAQYVYLANGEQMLTAKAGDRIAGDYRLITLAPGRLEFEHLPTGERQVLTIDTPSS